ncbi:MAG TPA: hypothetical protein VN667_20450 [Burkholderiales bacterium]|nr:hypothetical protein [Burkholderiales bacterium]
MGGSVFGGFMQGLQQGSSFVKDWQQKDAREAREQRESDQLATIRDLGIAKAQKQSTLDDKDIQLRGLKLDHDITQAGFDKDMQGFEQNTRRLLAENKQREAQIASGQLTEQQANQPDELTVQREDLQNKVLNAVQRQTANIYGIAKMGNTDMALDMVNRSPLVAPGEKFKSMKFEDVDVTDQKTGKAGKQRVLTLMPDKEGAPPRQIPVSMLDQLEQKFGATYQKVGNSLVRVNRDGSVVPLYEQDAYGVNTETGGLFNKRTGAPPPAAAGVAGAVGGPTKADGRLDDRVKMAIDKVILPKYGGKFEGGMFFPDEANKDVALRATALAGQLVRNGMAPEQAGAQAVQQAEREKALAANGGAQAGGYNGPTPWKR